MQDLYDKNGNRVKIPEIKNTINIAQNETIENTVFSNSGEYLTSYRIEANKAPSDVPISLNKYYHFITKIGQSIAIDYCTNQVMYIITYVNNDLVFRRLETTTVTQ